MNVYLLLKIEGVEVEVKVNLNLNSYNYVKNSTEIRENFVQNSGEKVRERNFESKGVKELRE